VKKLIMVLFLTVTVMLTACGGELTHNDCIRQNKFLHEGSCKSWSAIPYEDQDNVLTEIADIIADKQGISRDEALEIMHQIIVEGEDF
jgi:hypothetical protein